ncbi:hypothetical protein WA026_006705 [Henosepilachna vigintioctopunctata]|uniref:C-type lectin domain-containing protein n=1 Tax=Henosepilachna vigintioctopunctata TaxID=420089 RepID=A0AAW1UAS5_9CUCU
MKFVFISAALLSTLLMNKCSCIYMTNISATKTNFDSENPAIWTEQGIWGPMLEEWALGTKREKRVMRSDVLEHIVVVAKNKTKEKHDERESKIHNTKIVNSNNRISSSTPPNKKPPKQVSETDLYLLGAIEKLVYKVDFMEKRLRRVEEMLYFVMAGNRIDQDPCSENFTRVGMNCYYFASSAGREYDWKAASKHCKKLGAVLAEFETIEENQDIVTHLQATPHMRGKDFWTGGLNPGLLWIWSNSARPVSTTSNTNKKPNNQSNNILGDGRCLRLAYNPALRSYAYKGTDCSIRYNYICELPENSSSNEIKRIGRTMNVLKDE